MHYYGWLDTVAVQKYTSILHSVAKNCTNNNCILFAFLWFAKYLNFLLYLMSAKNLLILQKITSADFLRSLSALIVISDIVPSISVDYRTHHTVLWRR